MTYLHFEYAGEVGWETLGSGEGPGEDPLIPALEDLRGMYGGKLPVGSYQWIDSRGEDGRWRRFELDDSGRLVP